MSTQRLQKHVQKLANAAHLSFAERALLYDHNLFLSRINGEAKKRRLSKSVILGRAKVMSYKDIVEARAKRAVKDNTKSKRKGCQKYQVVAAEEDNFEPDAKENCRTTGPSPHVWCFQLQPLEDWQQAARAPSILMCFFSASIYSVIPASLMTASSSLSSPYLQAGKL